MLSQGLEGCFREAKKSLTATLESVYASYKHEKLLGAVQSGQKTSPITIPLLLTPLVPRKQLRRMGFESKQRTTDLLEVLTQQDPELNLHLRDTANSHCLADDKCFYREVPHALLFLTADYLRAKSCCQFQNLEFPIPSKKKLLEITPKTFRIRYSDKHQLKHTLGTRKATNTQSESISISWG